MSDVVLSVSHLTKRYGANVAVDDMTLSIDRGGITSIIGPNGAGKTTLFGMLAGDVQPSSGRVTMHGEDVSRLSPALRCRRGLSRTYQVARLFNSETLIDNVATAILGRTHRRPNPVRRFGRTDDFRRESLELLDIVGLVDAADRRAAELSHGDRKRLELAMALSQHPTVLVLDEPTAGMAIGDRTHTVDLLGELQRSKPDMTIVLTAHDVDAVFRLSQRVILVSQGRVVVDGPPDSVSSDARTREIYLGVSS